MFVKEWTRRGLKGGKNLLKQGIIPPEVVETKCVGCELCVTVCPSFVLEMRNKKAEVVRGAWCIGCDHCGAVCPTEAILYNGSSKRESRLETDPVPSPEALQRLFLERRSLRVYKKESVPDILLRRILDAGNRAPTGSNSQNVNYILLTSPESINQLRERVINFYDKIFSRLQSWFGSLMLSWMAGQKTVEYLRDALPKFEHGYKKMKEGEDRLFYHAPVVIITHAESWDSLSSFNCSVALYQCSLMAQSLGLGCCFNGFLVSAVNHHRKIKGWLGIPADHACYAAMTLGYPDIRYQRPVHRDPPKATRR
jgi:nitroreductase/Pyruvate/2-oxoacid:ferredoxin oxidoreductase delta subunit